MSDNQETQGISVNSETVTLEVKNEQTTGQKNEIIQNGTPEISKVEVAPSETVEVAKVEVVPTEKSEISQVEIAPTETPDIVKVENNLTETPDVAKVEISPAETTEVTQVEKSAIETPEVPKVEIAQTEVSKNSIDESNEKPLLLSNQESIMERIKQKEESIKMAIDDLKENKEGVQKKSEIKEEKPHVENINEPKIEVVPDVPKQCLEQITEESKIIAEAPKESKELNVVEVPNEIKISEAPKESNELKVAEAPKESNELKIAETPKAKIADENESKVLQLALETSQFSSPQKSKNNLNDNTNNPDQTKDLNQNSEKELFAENDILEGPIPKSKTLSLKPGMTKKELNIFEKKDSELTIEEEAISEYHRALNLIASDNVMEAENVLREILDIVPHYRGVRVELAKIYLKTDREDAAENLIQKGLSFSKDYPEFLKLMAIICERKSNPDLALEYLNRIPENQKRDLSTAAFIGQIYQQTGRYSLARNQYFQLLEREPNNPIWLLGISIALESEGKKKEALQGYKRILKEGALDMDLLRYIEERIANLKG